MFNARQIKDIIKDNNLCINKRLGQNFLIDENARDRFIKLCNINREDIILEIGPGLGALTEKILPSGARLTIVEKDRGLSVFLKGLLEDHKNLDIINEDILKYDIAHLFKKQRKKLKVIGNLPFYITSPIIFHLFKYKKYIDSIFITMQKEVAERIVSKPGSKDYGLLSCSIQYHCKPQNLMRIAKSHFYPQPEVDISLLRLTMLKMPSVKVKDEELFFKVIKAAFNQRRKTLFNALSGGAILKIDKDILKKAFESMSLDLKVRGETLSLEGFACLADALAAVTPLRA